MINLESKKAYYTIKGVEKMANNFNIAINKKGLEKKLKREIEYYCSKQQDTNNKRYKYQHDTRTPKQFIEEILCNNELEELLKIIIRSNSDIQALHRLGNSKPATSAADAYKVNGLPDYLLVDKDKNAYTLELQCCNLNKDAIYVKKHKIDGRSNINYLLLLDTFNNKYCLINPLEVDKSNFIKSIPNLGGKAGYEIQLDSENIFDFNKECFNVLDVINYKCFANA